MTESFTDHAAFMFTDEVHTCDWRESDNTFRINPHWFCMQNEQAREYLLAKCNEQDKVRRAYLKMARKALADMLAHSGE